MRHPYEQKATNAQTGRIHTLSSRGPTLGPTHLGRHETPSVRALLDLARPKPGTRRCRSLGTAGFAALGGHQRTSADSLVWRSEWRRERDCRIPLVNPVISTAYWSRREAMCTTDVAQMSMRLVEPSHVLFETRRVRRVRGQNTSGCSLATSTSTRWEAPPPMSIATASEPKPASLSLRVRVPGSPRTSSPRVRPGGVDLFPKVLARRV